MRPGPRSGARPAPLERAYRILLRAYPPRFRARWTAPMVDLLRERSAATGTGAARVVAWLLRDLVLSLPREWLRAWRGEDHPGGFARRRRRDRRRRNAVSRTLDELRGAARALARQPLFCVLASLTLALGIGANTAIFSVVRAVVLRPLPYEEPHRLVSVWPGQNVSKELLSRLRSEVETLDRFEAFSGWTVTLTGEGEPEELLGVVATPGIVELTGGRPVLGRGLAESDALPGAEPVALISHALWQRRFGSDPGVVGRRVRLGTSGRQGEERTVVGVLAPDHRFPDGRFAAGEVDAFLPLVIDPADKEDFEGSWYLTAIGRTAPGVSIDEASAELLAVARRLVESDFRHFEEETIAGVRVEPLQDHLVRDVRTPLLLLLGAVLLVLLVACANVANLFLVRASAREQELQVRSALGAGRRRLVVQLLLEGGLLAVAGGVIGTASAAGLLRVLRARLPEGVPRADQIAVDPGVLGFALVVTMLAALLFGLPPALRATGGGLAASVFRGAGAKAPSRGQHRLQHGLVLVEIALATVLVISAGLLLKSLATTVAVDPGFEPRGVVALAVSPAAGEHTRNRGWANYFDTLFERLRGVPGVESVGGIHLLPLTGGNWNFPYQAEDHPVPPNTPPPTANYRVVAGDYFRTLGIPLLEGRTFEAADRAGAPGVVMINQRMAHDLWPSESPLGKSIHLFMDTPYTVVGVVGDIHQFRLDVPAEPEMYYHLPQMQPTGRMLVMVRGSLPSTELVPVLRETVWAVDPDVPIGKVATLEEVVAQSVARTRLVAQLTTGFAALALLLGAVGVYGVMSYAASARRREIGVRMALGADRGAIVGSTVRGGLAWAIAGLAVGLAAAAAAGRLLEGLLFETSARDPFVYATVALALVAVAGLACFVPARRASRLDPVITLRQE